MKPLMIYKYLVLLGICTIIFLACGKRNDYAEGNKPNVLFIVADDQGSWTLNSESSPNTYTPELDKLAAQGALMRNAFAVSAVCSPSRAALISSRYPSETGILDYIGEGSKVGMDTSLVIWPELFQNAGYKTVMVGKWHLGDVLKAYFPEQRGFDRFSGFLKGGKQSRDPLVRMEGKDTVFNNQYTSDVLTDLAVNYIREFKEEPWLMCLHYWAPHANTTFPEGYKPPYEDRSWLPMKDEDLDHWRDIDLVLPDPDFPKLDSNRVRRMMREYYASVHSVDRNIGRIMKLLEDLNLEENTIIFFTSDHGYMMGHHGLWHKGNGRWITIDGKDPTGSYTGDRPNMYDLSLRVPFIVRWPGHIDAGKKIEQTITFLDCYPTLLEMAGIEKPDDLVLRGNSFYPLLKGSNAELSDTIFAQYKTLRCIRTSDWKFVYHFSDTIKNEFYNLTNDPGEYNNVILASDKEIIQKKKEMMELLFLKMKEIDDSVILE
jgi:choline-sulfatase